MSVYKHAATISQALKIAEQIRQEGNIVKGEPRKCMNEWEIEYTFGPENGPKPPPPPVKVQHGLLEYDGM